MMRRQPHCACQVGVHRWNSLSNPCTDCTRTGSDAAAADNLNRIRVDHSACRPASVCWVTHDVAVCYIWELAMRREVTGRHPLLAVANCGICGRVTSSCASSERPLEWRLGCVRILRQTLFAANLSVIINLPRQRIPKTARILR